MKIEDVAAEFERQFNAPPTVIARAPGRIEFIGNHVDYNGGCVIGASVDRHVWVAARATHGGRIRMASRELRQRVECNGQAPRLFSGEQGWANYPLAVWLALRDFKLPAPVAFDLAIVSTVPAGAGMSSSAALELATALALHRLTGAAALTPAELAAIGRHAENAHVGVPCGILDQGTSAFGGSNHLVHIDCRGPHFRQMPVPHGVRLWVFNTAEKHALINGLYATRHRECQDAAKVANVPWLTDIQPRDIPAFSDRLDEVLARRLAHVVQEHNRVAETVAALDLGDLARVGELLFASHDSSSRLFENSTANLDSLVSILRECPGVRGARLTGGGFGGAVMALTTESFTRENAAAVADAHVARGFGRPEIIPLNLGEGAAVVHAA